MDFFKDCTALITGASSGIGEETARQLAPYAGRLVLVARRAERLDALKGELEALWPGLQVTTYAIDLLDAKARKKMIKWLGDEALEIDLLVNNAGLGDYGAFATSDWTKIHRILEVNITALTALTHDLLPPMIERGRGAVLNVSSIAAFFPVPNLAVYAATKAYVNSFSEAIRAELRGTGVSVTTLCPGPVETEFRNVADRESGDRMPAPDISKVSVSTVVRRGLLAVADDRPQVIPGWMLAIGIPLIAAIPLLLMRPVLNAMAKSKDP